MNKIPLSVNNETGRLRSVVVGIADDRSDDNHGNNPKYAEIVKRGENPSGDILKSEMNTLAALLEQHEVKVYRPKNIPNRTQIFARDIAFVVGDTLVKANMKLENRQKETGAIDHLATLMEKVIAPPADAFIEGGDVLLWNDYVFVGLGARTNVAGCEFLAKAFPSKKVVGLHTVVSEDPFTNIVHLDCAFQPVGDKYAIIFDEGFKSRPDAIYDLFGEQNLIKVSSEEMYNMFTNVFSVSQDLVVIERNFTRLITELEKRGVKTVPINYGNVAKLGGMLRCSTLPLYRE
ncbi:MAG: arginine deiminase family protein [Cyclobacteriaceae bacterium]